MNTYTFDFNIGDQVIVRNMASGTVTNINVDRKKDIWYYVEWFDNNSKIVGDYFSIHELQ